MQQTNRVVAPSANVLIKRVLVHTIRTDGLSRCVGNAVTRKGFGNVVGARRYHGKDPHGSAFFKANGRPIFVLKVTADASRRLQFREVSLSVVVADGTCSGGVDKKRK